MKNSKRKVLKLRREGKSLRDIKKALGVPKSTLSNWLKEVELTEEQKEKLKRNKEKGAEKGRKKAALIHKKQKREKINKIKERVKEFTSEVKINQEIGETIFLSSI